MKKVIIYTDGGARGNPGPAGVGAVVDGREFKKFIGEATNNVAEYRAIIMALEEAKDMFKNKAKEVELEMRMDSELVKKQLSGEYRVKDVNLKKLYNRVKELLSDFGGAEFVHILREENGQADGLANEAMDEIN